MTLSGLVRSLLNGLRPRRPTSWSRVEQVLAGALEVPTDERQSYLDRECAGDSRLRAEVAILLAASDRRGLLDQPIATLLSALAPDEVPTVEAKGAPEILSHFELLTRIPGGGMGVIYRARDTRLHRVVALKVLPSALSSDANAKARFLLEARAAAALDHPNVCAIHEVGETADSQLFISMPFYEGETVASRLLRGPFAIREAASIAGQIAHGLAHAHDRGIIHRDVKPANLMLTGDGVIKILDFGIVKLPGVGLTKTGGTVGTLPYMSPEQLRGETVDGRTDIWSLGVVLYEMLAGRRPFHGRDEHATREAIEFAQPASLQVARPDVPEDLARFVNRLLAKHLGDRPADIKTVVERLEGLCRSLTLGPAVSDPAAASAQTDAEALAHVGAEPTDVLPEGERRQATVVILRLSGYADLVERCSPQEVDELTRRLKHGAWEIVERHGGTINEFGEERIVLVFGVPVSLEDHGARATRAALELRALVRACRTVRTVAHRLASHTAIDTGEVAVRRLESSIIPYRIAGRPMRRAAQLCSHAPADEVLLTPDAERAVVGQFRLAPAAPVPLAEESLPLTPLVVVEERAPQDRLDQLAGRDDLTEYTGRERELAALTQAFTDAAEGRGRLVTVSGDAGLGKSRLLLELRRTLDPASVTVLIGRCSAYGQATAYLPFLQALRQLLGLEPSTASTWTDEDVAARILEIDAGLEPLLPYYLRLLAIASERHRAASAEIAEQPRLAVMEALVALFVGAARRRPLILLLEDWHWVDAASHETLKRLVDLLAAHRLLVVMTTRSAKSPEWANREPHQTIMLRPLPPTASSAVLRSVLAADDVPMELAARVHERTGGNPFFVEEVARSLIESGTVRIDGRRACLAGPIDALHMPANVQAVIRTRLDRFDWEVRQVLRAAAVVGRDFTPAILVRVLSHAERVAPALDMLSAAGIIRQTAIVPEPAYTFAHALIQETAYAGLLEHQRADLHNRVGTALEELYNAQIGDWLDRLAQHFSLAEIWPKAVHYGLAAAERTRGLYQFVDALRLLERTREWSALLDDEKQRRRALVDLLFRQESLCDLLGMRDRHREIVDELVSLLKWGDDPLQLAEAYLHKGELHTILREFELAEESLETSLRIRRARGDALGERASLRGLGFLRWCEQRYKDALACNEAALAIDRRHQRLSAVVGDLHNLGSVHGAMGNLERARACLEEALQLSEPAKHREDGHDDLWEARVSVLYSYGALLARCGDLDGALAYLGTDGEWMRDSRHPLRGAHFFTAAAHVHLRKGMIAECLEDYRRAIEITRRNCLAPQLAQALQSYGDTLIAIGRERDALAPLEEAARVYGQLTDRPAEALSWSHVARVHERLGNVPEAQSVWHKAFTQYRDAGNRQGEIEALEGLGRVARRHLPSSVALRFYEDAIALAAITNDDREARLRNSAGIIEWTCARYENALAHFERAQRIFEALGDQVAAGQMMNSIGVSLQALGRAGDAREQLLGALAHHRRIGQPQLEGHALASLGDSCWDAGASEEAAGWYEQSLHKRTAVGDARGEGWMLQRLARVRVALGDLDHANALLAQAIAVSTHCSDEELMEECMQLRRTLAHSPGRTQPVSTAADT
jgi:tetratricopeptide (TPR) repeat protein/class 3 adenylate cyclase